jgi:hypothetical protein
MVTTLRHGHARRSGHSAEHRAWQNMLQRCRNPKHPHYASYGGRGIRVADRWLVFENFLADMGPRPPSRTLERLNNERGYSWTNCEWATRASQARNRRSTKLTPAAAAAIRKSGASHRLLAARFGICRAMVHKIKAGKSW